MAWAIFSRRFDWHRPGSKVSFSASQAAKPQQWPHDFIEAAVKARAAVKVDPPNREQARTFKGKGNQRK
jgi:hypothetical protein